MNYYLLNDALREYFLSLPFNIQDKIIKSGVELSTLGELMQVAKHM